MKSREVKSREERSMYNIENVIVCSFYSMWSLADREDLEITAEP
jgi:hypothetical protein